MASSHALRRIVCLEPSATVILAAIDEPDCVVACTEYCADVDPEIVRSSVAILADSWTANTEKIVATRPDLVIAAVPYPEDAVIRILKSGARWFSPFIATFSRPKFRQHERNPADYRRSWSPTQN
jgi:ABC-type Fe3+-hydroxamate transport system substrate-binding protein